MYMLGKYEIMAIILFMLAIYFNPSLINPLNMLEGLFPVFVLIAVSLVVYTILSGPAILKPSEEMSQESDEATMML